jgi:hypothetical protein
LATGQNSLVKESQNIIVGSKLGGKDIIATIPQTMLYTIGQVIKKPEVMLTPVL